MYPFKKFHNWLTEYLAFEYALICCFQTNNSCLVSTTMLIRPTIAITSLLTRAQATLDLVQQKAGLTNIPVIRFPLHPPIFSGSCGRPIFVDEKVNKQFLRDWRLNERHYGVLTGLNKADCVQRLAKRT